MRLLLYFPLVLLFLCSCSSEKPVPAKMLKCIDCHAIETDPNHQIACTTCHQGITPAKDKTTAHSGITTEPAHPQLMESYCGKCHAEIISQISKTAHFTLKNSTNLFRMSFGASAPLDSFLDTPATENPTTGLELADDLLRRRCFRCHPYNPGDLYPAVSHGTGCAACHLSFDNGALESHIFVKPDDNHCLSCHYGNYVGFDYYGRFEHDLNIEYRTPYTTQNRYFRPYGVEYHQLSPDIHQVKGMGCVDCHSGREMMQPGSEKITCKGCHSHAALERTLPDRVEKSQGVFILKSKSGQQHIIPLMQHPAHFNRKEKIACQSCHAVWTFNDIGKHFIRIDTDDVDSLANLTVQGSLEVENVIENNSDFDKDEIPVQMTDKITGALKPGIWHRGFNMRRWEDITLGRDKDGKIAPMRPMLDYHLSWIDDEE
ncbi:MAG: hypothetical protein ACN4GW_06375, partial [Desulforhopalus sp.]